MPNAQEVLEWIAWDRRRKSKITNEEWFCGLSTEEKAIIISQLSWYKGDVYKLEKWLKEVHEK